MRVKMRSVHVHDLHQCAAQVIGSVSIVYIQETLVITHRSRQEQDVLLICSASTSTDLVAGYLVSH